MKNGINDNILSLISKTPDSLMLGIAERVKVEATGKGMDAKYACYKIRSFFGFL